MTTDIKINLSGDIDISLNNFQLAKDGDYIKQKLEIVLRTFLGEWFLNISDGVPYFEDIFKKNFNPARIETVIKAEILKVLGVDKITAFDMNLLNRQLEIDFTVSTNYGELNITESLTVFA